MGVLSLQESPVLEQSSQHAFLGLFLPEVLLALDARGLRGDEASRVDPLPIFLPEADAERPLLAEDDAGEFVCYEDPWALVKSAKSL